jgi:hypothetical protein
MAGVTLSKVANGTAVHFREYGDIAARGRAKRTLLTAKVLEMLKVSGALNPDVTLDQLMKVSARLDIPGSAAGADSQRGTALRVQLENWW